jgi:LPXTG-motif cell wall-anchored protein
MKTTKLAGVRSMKRVATATMAGLVVVLATLSGFAPAQAAASCAAGEGNSGGVTVKICLTPAETTVVEGNSFDVDGTAETSNGDDVDCITETYKFRGHSNGSGTFNAGQVDKDTDFGVKYTCTYETDDIKSLGAGGSRVATALITDVVGQSATGIVHVLNKGKDGNGHHKKHKNKDDDDDNGNLPNTGGERLAWLVIGLLLVAAGSTVVVSSRKRDSVA